MLYTLPDGREIDLDQVIRVSRIRDEGMDSNSIEYSKLSFHVYFSERETVEVWVQYHYADWAEQKKRLKQIRDDLLKAINGEVDDT